MAQVTMELRDILRMKNFELFDFDYPIVDATWKKEFEELFINYYYFYEIGTETIDRFKHLLKARLNLIMPYYNELYESKLFEINPLLTSKIKEVYKYSENQNTVNTTIDKTNTSNKIDSTGNSEDNTQETEYPQTSSIESDIPSRRAKNTNATTSETSTTGTTNYTSDNDISQTSKKDYEKIIEGLSGDQNELLRSYRQNIVNINRLLIEDLKTLFILVY